MGAPSPAMTRQRVQHAHDHATRYIRKGRGVIWAVQGETHDDGSVSVMSTRTGQWRYFDRIEVLEYSTVPKSEVKR